MTAPEIPAHWIRLNDVREHKAPEGGFRIIADQPITVGQPYIEYIVGDFDHQGRAQNEARILGDQHGMDTRVFDDRGLCIFISRQRDAPNWKRPIAVTKMAELLHTPIPRRRLFKKESKRS